MAKFEHKEGRGKLFKARERKTEKSPHFTGNAMYKGEVIQISGWAELNDDGKLQAISLAVQEPREKSDAPAKKSNSDDDSWGI
jgi:hypothetical protein